LVNSARTSSAELKDPATAKGSNPANPGLTAAQLLQSQLGDLVGWPGDGKVAAHIPGWVLTIVAVSLGAPFWFDTLNRFMSLRAAGKAPVVDETAGK
jgi:hypothetical protein